MGFTAVHVGIDVGKTRDPTAIVVTQVMTDVLNPTRYITQHMERIPLDTSYPDIAAHCVKVIAALAMMINAERSQRLRALMREVAQTGEQVTHISGIDLRAYIDATGVGRPVYDMIANAIARDERTRRCETKMIIFAKGETYNVETGTMGKAFLVSRMQVLLQERRFLLPPRHEETPAMVRELKDYDITVSDDGKDTYGAKTGAHDDLVTAAGLTVIDDPAQSGVRVRTIHAQGRRS